MQRLDKLADAAKDSLEIKRKVVENKQKTGFIHIANSIFEMLKNVLGHIGQITSTQLELLE